MCLDVLRAIQRDRESIEVLFQSFAKVAAQDVILHNELQALFKLFSSLQADELQFMARSLVSRLVILAQAILLKQYAPDYVAAAFIQTRYSEFHGRVVGMIDAKVVDVKRLLARAWAD